MINEDPQALFDECVKRLCGDTPLPDGMDTKAILKRMARFHNRVIEKCGPDTNPALQFFMTFFAGYLCGHIDKSVKGGQDPWTMPHERN